MDRHHDIEPEEVTAEPHEPPPDFDGAFPQDGDDEQWVEPLDQFPMPGEPLPAPAAPLMDRIRVLNLSNEWVNSCDNKLRELIKLADSAELACVLDLAGYWAREKMFSLSPILRTCARSQQGLDEIELLWHGIWSTQLPEVGAIRLEDLDWFGDLDLETALGYLEPHERRDLARPYPSPTRERARKKFLQAIQGLLYQRHCQR